MCYVRGRISLNPDGPIRTFRARSTEGSGSSTPVRSQLMEPDRAGVRSPSQEVRLDPGWILRMWRAYEKSTLHPCPPNDPKVPLGVTVRGLLHPEVFVSNSGDMFAFSFWFQPKSQNSCTVGRWPLHPMVALCARPGHQPASSCVFSHERPGAGSAAQTPDDRVGRGHRPGRYRGDRFTTRLRLAPGLYILALNSQR